MAEQPYITVDRSESPRLIEIAVDDGGTVGGSNEVSIQDLHDTLNSNTLPAGDPDDSLDNMDDDFLIDSAGKENLGGGLGVGITSTLNNAQVAFAGNYTAAQTGTATSADALGTTLTDINGEFQTNGITRGYWVINYTDESITEVLEVLSETVLLHRPLTGNGTASGADWQIGDRYALFEVVQKEISGGNIVAVDDSQAFPGGANISPIFPSFATQVIRTAASSATIQNLTSIEQAIFAASLNVIAGSSSTEVRTDATQADNFYDGMTLVVVNSEGTVSRDIASYANTNGAFTLNTALPFIPALNDKAIVINANELIQSIFANAALIPATL